VSRIPADKTLVSTDKSYNFVGIVQKRPGRYYSGI
jgi:hypothetical protein